MDIAPGATQRYRAVALIACVVKAPFAPNPVTNVFAVPERTLT